MASRFTQLLLLSLLILFLPTLFYLRPTSPAPIYSPSTGSWYGAAGSVPGSADNGGGTTQGKGVMGDDGAGGGGGGWKWPENLVEPAKMKAGDYWKSWKESWKTQGSGSKAGAAGAGAAGGVGGGAAVLPEADSKGAFASKMGNETAKAELGRATWRFLHTMTLRFPDHPTEAQRSTLSTFFHTFALLYPCGECANHFQELLRELPPQTSSRMAASLWLCAAHNKVNKRLGKDEFPCDKLDETYDCGCGPDPATAGAQKDADKLSGGALAAVAAAAAGPVLPAQAPHQRRHRSNEAAAGHGSNLDQPHLSLFDEIAMLLPGPILPRDGGDAAPTAECGLCTLRE